MGMGAYQSSRGPVESTAVGDREDLVLCSDEMSDEKVKICYGKPHLCAADVSEHI